MEDMQAMPCPDMRWVHAARASGGKTVAARSQAKLQALKPGEGLKEDFVCMFIFSDISNAGMLITIST